MKDLYGQFTQFKEDHADIYEKSEELGEYIHQHGGPLPDKTRWLIKVGISAASRHQSALGTHIARSREAGASEEEVLHALFLVIPTCGWPTFMEAYRVYTEK